MKNRYLVHTFKFVVALATCILCLVLAGVMVYLREWIALPILALIFVIFAYVTVLYGSVVSVDEKGVHLTFLGISRRSVPWSDIREVGIVGVKVFNNNEPKLTGSRYIYFSPRTMDDAARFKLALEWPPKDMLYVSYARQRVEEIQLLWTGPIETYNAGDAFF